MDDSLQKIKDIVRDNVVRLHDGAYITESMAARISDKVKELGRMEKTFAAGYGKPKTEDDIWAALQERFGYAALPFLGKDRFFEALFFLEGMATRRLYSYIDEKNQASRSRKRMIGYIGECTDRYGLRSPIEDFMLQNFKNPFLNFLEDKQLKSVAAYVATLRRVHKSAVRNALGEAKRRPK